MAREDTMASVTSAPHDPQALEIQPSPPSTKSGQPPTRPGACFELPLLATHAQPLSTKLAVCYFCSRHRPRGRGFACSGAPRFLFYTHRPQLEATPERRPSVHLRRHHPQDRLHSSPQLRCRLPLPQSPGPSHSPRRFRPPSSGARPEARRRTASPRGASQPHLAGERRSGEEAPTCPTQPPRRRPPSPSRSRPRRRWA